MLENRQKSSWDQYLPGHGMLITLINYSSYTWSYNTVNNDPNSMGVDLIEANNNSSSVSGADPFPGTSNVTSYVPRLRNGTLLSDKELTNITESSGVIYFDFAGGATTFLRYTGNVRDFSVYDNAISEAQKVALIGNGLIDSVEFSFVYGNHFDILSPDSQWVKHMKLNDSNGQLRADLSIRYNPLNFGSHSDRLMITSPDALPIYIDVHGVNRDKTALEDLTNTLVYVITTSSEWQIYAEDQGEYEVSLYTITGQRLFSSHFVGSVNVENASHARGVYLLEMRQMSTGKKQIIKVVR